jgi:hypothetical protein
MLEGTGDGLVTTSSHGYAQSTYHMCIMCINSLCLNNHDVSPCFTVLICFRRINHLAVKIPFAFILWCTRSCVEHSNSRTPSCAQGWGHSNVRHGIAIVAVVHHRSSRIRTVYFKAPTLVPRPHFSCWSEGRTKEDTSSYYFPSLNFKTGWRWGVAASRISVKVEDCVLQKGYGSTDLRLDTSTDITKFY